MVITDYQASEYDTKGLSIYYLNIDEFFKIKNRLEVF